MTDLLAVRIDRFEVAGVSVSGCVEALRALGTRVCSFESLPADHDISLSFRGVTLRHVLDSIVGKSSGYRWDEPSPGLINLVPSESVLDSHVPDAAVQSKGAWRVLDEDLQIGRLGITRFEQFGGQDGPAVSVAWEHADLRAALNAIILRMTSSVWHISGQSGAYYLDFTVVPAPGGA